MCGDAPGDPGALRRASLPGSAPPHAHLWTGSTPLERFDVGDLVLGARLAHRLGGWRISRWLLRAALERAPDDPLVRYFTGSLRRRRASYVDDLRQLEVEPELATDDPTSSRAGSPRAPCCGPLCATSTAPTRVSTAPAPSSAGTVGVESCESDVLGLEDRWRDALDAAARSWQLSGGAPFSAQSLGNAWLNLGEVEQAADHLERAATNGESYELSYLAARFHAAHADTLQGEDRIFAVARARAMADGLPERAPLLDRESSAAFAGLRLLIAELADDHVEMERWATEARSPST